MFTTPDNHYTLLTHHGMTVRLSPPTYFYCYLCHFSEPYKHARHYIGMTGCLDARLKLHRAGGGARLLEVITDAGITFEVSRLWQCDTYEAARALERKLKRTHGHGPALCPICQHKPLDLLVGLRQGHWPLALHDRHGRRRPSPRYQNQPFERR